MFWRYPAPESSEMNHCCKLFFRHIESKSSSEKDFIFGLPQLSGCCEIGETACGETAGGTSSETADTGRDGSPWYFSGMRPLVLVSETDGVVVLVVT